MSLAFSKVMEEGGCHSPSAKDGVGNAGRWSIAVEKGTESRFPWAGSDAWNLTK